MKLLQWTSKNLPFSLSYRRGQSEEEKKNEVFGSPLQLLFGLFILLTFISCKKDSELSTKDVFVQPITSENEFAAVGSMLLNDGNYLIVTADQVHPELDRLPGNLIKLDQKGKIIWNKRLSEANRIIWRVIDLPGTGFATLGRYFPNDTYMFICIYDYDGNLLSNNRVNTNDQNYYITPFDFILLSNGNFALAGGDEGYDVGFLKILDPSFNLLYSKSFFAPDSFYNASFHGICEQPDGNIALMARTTSINHYLQKNLLLIRTTPEGKQLSASFLPDSNYYETTNALESYNNGLVAVTSGITRGKDDGAYVNYTNNTYAQLISGRINLVCFDNVGNFSSKKAITGYKGDGMISSMRKTDDGGFILCGTVDQASSAVIVSYTKIFLVKLNPDLSVEWSRAIDTTNPSYGIDAFQTPDGGFLVTGNLKSLDKQYEVVVIKMDAHGNF